MSGLFASGCQSIGASAFVFPMNVQGWFPLGLTGLNPLLSKKLSKVFFSTTIWKHQFFGVQPSLWQKWSLWPVTSSVQSLSSVWLFATPCTASFSVLHYLPEFAQTHVHWVSDAIQPSQPLSSTFPPAPNPSQHQSLFQWVNSSHEVAKRLEFQLQHHSFQRNPRADLL